MLDREFDHPAPNTAWVTDITYIRTGEGWLCLIAILALFSRRVVGWKTSDRLDASFCREALLEALMARRPAPGLIVHADQRIFLAHAARGVGRIDHQREEERCFAARPIGAAASRDRGHRRSTAESLGASFAPERPAQ